MSPTDLQKNHRRRCVDSAGTVCVLLVQKQTYRARISVAFCPHVPQICVPNCVPMPMTLVECLSNEIPKHEDRELVPGSSTSARPCLDCVPRPHVPHAQQRTVRICVISGLRHEACAPFPECAESALPATNRLGTAEWFAIAQHQ
jgi:hypothetical protein